MGPSERDRAKVWERTVERLFRPGTYIPDRACGAFVSDLEELVAEVRKETADQPEWAAAQYEILLAACYEKTEELDDSSGRMGMFVESLFCGWAQTRQAAKADPGQTASWLLARMDEDPHGYCLHLEREVAKVLGVSERAAFLLGIEARAGAGEDGRLAAPGAAPQRWVDALRKVYLVDGKLDAYIALAESAGLGAKDCEEIAGLLTARERFSEALTWVERGLGLHKRDWSSHGLQRLRRALLVKLGRSDEALQSAWADFTAHPTRYSFEPVAVLIPKNQRPAWRERILTVVGSAQLKERMELLLMLEEPDLLASLVDQTTNADLEEVSHTVGEPAAALLEQGHPGVAARLWRAQAQRILRAKRSQYYEVAVLDLAHARDGFLAAGQGEAWGVTVAQVRAEHRRKLGFMADFERLVAGAAPKPQPTFLERAKAKWQNGWSR